MLEGLLRLRGLLWVCKQARKILVQQTVDTRIAATPQALAAARHAALAPNRLLVVCASGPNRYVGCLHFVRGSCPYRYVGPDWNASFSGLGWDGQGHAGLSWAGLGCAGPSWAGLHWAGLGWAGLHHLRLLECAHAHDSV